MKRTSKRQTTRPKLPQVIEPSYVERKNGGWPKSFVLERKPAKPVGMYQYVMDVSESVVEYGIWESSDGATMTTVEAWNKYKPELKRGAKLKLTFHAHSWELACAIYQYIMYKSAYKPMK